MIFLGQIDLKLVTIDTLNLSSENCNSYSDSGRNDLQNLLSTLNITKRDTIIDFGCGKGGALITFADYPFSKITGIEISNELVIIAQKNLSKLKIINAEIFCCDAKEFNMIDDYNYIYLFNPFPCSVMRIVIKNITSSITKRKRRINIIYLNPECHNVIIENGVFSKVKEIKHHNHVFYIYNNEHEISY
jgi:SAM-dependent methyltransferase